MCQHQGRVPLKPFSDLNLLIVGRGPQENELKQLTGKLRLSDKVKLTGKVASPELKQKIYRLNCGRS